MMRQHPHLLLRRSFAARTSSSRLHLVSAPLSTSATLPKPLNGGRTTMMKCLGVNHHNYHLLIKNINTNRSTSFLRSLSSSSHNENSKFNDSDNSESSSLVDRQETNEEDTEWIPPDRPLSGDTGNSQLYHQLTKKRSKEIDNNKDFQDDWMKDAIEQDMNQILKRANENGKEIELVDIDQLDLDSVDWEVEEEGQSDKIYSDFFLREDDDESDEDSESESVDEDYMDIDDVDFDDKMLAEIMNDLENNPSSKKKQEQEEEERLPSYLTEDGSGLDEFLKEQNKANNSPDWLATRRSQLNIKGTTKSGKKSSSSNIIPIKKHTLLSSAEIESTLRHYNAKDITVVTPPTPELVQMLGWDGLIIATGISYSHLRTVAEALVKQLRLRDLGSVGVVGARYGVEGGSNADATKSKRKRRSANNTLTAANSSHKMDDGWMVVDCRNYVVHIQDKLTRESLDLEGLWSGGERGKEGQRLRNISLSDEESVDDYISDCPVPEKYALSLMSDSRSENEMERIPGIGFVGGSMRAKSGRWTPVGDKRKKMKNRGKKSRRYL